MPLCVSLLPCRPHDPFITEKRFHKMYVQSPISLPPNYMAAPPFRHGNGGIRDETLYRRPLNTHEMTTALRDYYAMVTGLDFHLGRVFDKLKADGLWEKTYIVFTSDQGLAVGGRHGMNGKSTLYEEYKSPLVFYGPGIQKGHSEALVYLFDIYPTLCELSGIAVPSFLSGKSLMPFIKPSKQSSGKWMTQLQWRKSLFTCFRKDQGLYGKMVRNAQFKLMWYPDLERFVLFDLLKDPFELVDLSTTKLDVLAAMKELMIYEQLQLGDDVLANTTGTFVPFPLMQREIEALAKAKAKAEAANRTAAMMGHRDHLNINSSPPVVVKRRLRGVQLYY
jgi:arylsulfatase A-like enzyme